MTEAAPEQTDDQKLRKAYGLATTRLRDAHREEFTRLQTEEAKKLGVDYKPRPTKVDKAREQLRALVGEHPELLDELAAQAQAKS